MNISKEKFDNTLPCNMEPFGFIEKVTRVKTKWAGDLSIVSFGALDYNNHYSPEFGGVALLHNDPDLFMGVHYLPWSVEDRELEHNRSVEFLQNNPEAAPNVIIDTFYADFLYSLPTKQERKRRDYLEAVRCKNNGVPVPAKKAPAAEKHNVPGKKPLPKQVTDFLDGEQLI